MCFKDKVVRMLLILFAFLFMADFFLHPLYFKEMANFILVIIFALAIPEIPRVNKRVCLSFLFLGLFLFIFAGASFMEMLMAVGKNSGLVMLFVSVPVMTMPFFYEDYQSELGNIAKKYMKTLFPFLIFIQISTYFLSLVIAMGCLLIMYELFHKSAKEYNCQLLFRMALLEGYAAAGIWAPSWAPPPIITARLDLQWLDIVPAGIVFSILALCVTAILIKITISRNGDRYPKLVPDKSIDINVKKVITMFVLAGVLIGSLILTNYKTGWSMFVIIPIISFPFALICALLQDKMPRYVSDMKAYYSGRIVRGKPEICLFVIGGFLGGAFDKSGVVDVILGILPESLFIYPVVSAFIIMSLIVLLSLPGIHPVVLAPALAIAIVPETIGLNNYTFAMTLLAGWALGVNFSPFSSASMIMAGLEQKSPWEIGPYTNWKFAVSMIVIFSLAVGVLDKLN